MRNVILHPLLFAVFPVLSLYFHNQGHPVPPVAVVRGVVIALLLAGLVWGAAHLVLREASRAAWIASLTVILALSYGHLALAASEFLRRFLDIRTGVMSLTLLLPWLVVLMTGAGLIARTQRRVESWNPLGNAAGAILIAVSLVGGVMGAGGSAPGPLTDVDAEIEDVVAEDPARLPDIYYIVLDEYPNGRVLEEVFDHDNPEFHDALRARGFAVPEKTRSNYAHTFLSLASTLNMRHLLELTDLLGEDNPDPSVPYAMVGENAVMQVMKDAGYEVVHFDSGWVVTEHISQADETIRCGTISEFERTLIANTIFNLYFDEITRGDMRERVDCQFTKLGQLPDARRDAEHPTFTFAHIISPHPPFVFGPNGEDVDQDAVIDAADDPHEARIRMYLNQVTYVNTRILDAVDRILAQSDTPPVIIIQSDHGSNRFEHVDGARDVFLKDRFRNFNAILLPGHKDAVPEEMTNVNTFPIVLNAVLGTDFEMQANASYYTARGTPYRFEDVTDLVAFE